MKMVIKRLMMLSPPPARRLVVKLICLPVGALLILPLLLFNEGVSAPVQESNSSMLEAEGRRARRGISEVFDIPGMPVKINNVSLSHEGGLRINYSLINYTGKKVTAQLKAFLFDASGRFKQSEEWFEIADAKAGAIQGLFFDELESELAEGDLIVIAISEVIGRTGFWSVDEKILEAEVRNRIAGRPASVPVVRFEPNLLLNNEEKAELYQSALGHVLEDKELAGLLALGGERPLILSTKNLESLPMPATDANFILLSPDEIQKRAAGGSFIYLSFSPTRSEGSRIYFSLESHKSSKPSTVEARTSKQPAPYRRLCCGTALFEYHKEHGKWVGSYTPDALK